MKLLASAILDVAIEAFGGATSVPVPAEPIEQRLVHIDDLLRAAIHWPPLTTPRAGPSTCR